MNKTGESPLPLKGVLWRPLLNQSPGDVAIYELKNAELDGIEGQGYAYPVKTFRGKEYKGVFFAEDPEALEAVAEKEGVAFSGTVYETTRERTDTLQVEVVKTVSAAIGKRADFVVKGDDEA